MKRRAHVCALATITTSALILAAVGQAAAAEDPGPPTGEQTDLVLLLDGSGSISAADWSLQLDGYAAALQDRVNVPLDGSIAVSVIQLVLHGAGCQAPASRLF